MTDQNVFRPVVRGREGLPRTIPPEKRKEAAPPLWSDNVWGDSKQAREARAEERARLPGSKTPSTSLRREVSHEALRRVAEIEDEMRQKLAAMANFNESERSLLLRAFHAIDVHPPHNLVTKAEFSRVWRSLGISSSRLGKEEITAMFYKFGMDSTGRLPYEVFACRLLDTPGRRKGLEDRKAGPYEATGDFTFKGRIKYHPCRKEVYTPSDWDSKIAARSAKSPKAGLSLEFVYGYGGLANTASNICYTETAKVVYYTAAVGIVYDPVSHTQLFFHGHDDDIKCLAMHPNRRLVASGQVASVYGAPYLCIWDTNERVEPDGTKRIEGLVRRIPMPDVNNHSMRAVIAVAFSPDKEGSRLVCVTGDNDHTVWVFNWRKGTSQKLHAAWPPVELVCTGHGGKGTPPQVWGMSWNPFGANPNTKTLGMGEFVTYGVKHIKLWRLCRDENGPYYGLPGKRGAAECGKFGSCRGMIPQDVMSAAFVPLPSQEGSLLVTGARSGEILLWSLERGLECKRVVRAHQQGTSISKLPASHGGVRALHLRDDRQVLLSGGSDGRVLPWAVNQLVGSNPELALITPEVVQLPALYKSSNGTVFPHVCALASKVWSPEYVVGTHACDIWHVHRTAEPIVYGHSAFVQGLCFHPTKPSWFVTASEACRVFVWDAHKRCLLAKRNVHRPTRCADFSPDGMHLAIGGKDGSFLVLQFTKEMGVLQRPDNTLVDIKHCAEAIDEIKFSPDGQRLAVGSHDNFIDIYDTSRNSYVRLARCTGHSSYITHLDWAEIDPQRPDRRVLQSTDGAYELLHFDGNTGLPFRSDLRDEKWATFTCTLGFPVMGIWPRSLPGEKAADGTDVNACCRGKAYGEEYLVTADDSGKVKLFNYPCVVKHAPFRAQIWDDGQSTGIGIGYAGHSSHVVNVRFSPDGRRVISVGGNDQAVFQWRVDPVAKEQYGAGRHTSGKSNNFDPIMEAPVIIKPPRAVMFAPDEPVLDPNVVPPPQPPVSTKKAKKHEILATLEEDAAEVQSPIKPEQGSEAAKAEEKRKAMATECEYVITVSTSDIRGAGTDANVYLALYGEDTEGNLLAVAEFRLDNDRNNFERGRVDEFTHRANDVGELTHARIRHDNTGLAPGWHLHKVIVHNKTKAWKLELLPQNVWLDLSEGDGQICRTLSPSGSDGKPEVEPVDYTVTITTSDIKGAGTDATVFIELVGDKGTSGRRLLDNSKNNFERGQIDVFYLQAVVGKLQRVRIGHDNTGLFAGWHLQDVCIRAANEPEVHFDLPVGGRWFATDEDDGQVERDLYIVGPDARPTNKACKYKVVVYTSDIKFAGTDANVFIDIRGAKCNSGRRKLASSKNNFERASVDTFFLEAPDLGQLVAVEIGHDNRGMGAGWHLSKVVVVNENTGASETFSAGRDGAPGGRWFAGDEDDKATWRVLPALQSSEVVYTVTVYTSDCKYAGTDADVVCTLYGTATDGKQVASPPDMLLSNSKNNFERARVDVFDLPPMADLGELSQIRIGHNNSGLGAGWHLDHVEVTNDKTRQMWYFPCGRWFDTKEPPQQTTQILPAAARNTQADTCDYKVTVHTSDVKFAGTDANVHINLFGSSGNTGEQLLSNSKNNFERGKVDVFSLKGVPNVGGLTHVVIGHDNSLLGAGWHLNQVEVYCVNSGESVVFPADRWLATDEDPYQTTQTLYPYKDGVVGQSSSVDYQVDVYTSDVRFAGTDANVTLQLFGQLEDGTVKTSAEIPLENSKNNFERNQHDTFFLKLASVGKITKIQIGHDGSGMGSAWHLARVEIRQGSDRYTFLYDAWLDKENGTRAVLTTESNSDSNMCAYKVVVFTSDLRGAGTDANVTIKLYGDGDLSLEEMPLASSANNFERNKMDEFVLKGPKIGDIRKIDIGHDGKWPLSGWHLNKVMVQNLSTNHSVFFHCNRWLDAKHGRRVVLTAGSAEDVEHQYQVTVHTSDIRGAGTDANVSVVVYGEKGDSGTRLLDNSANNFERNSTDVFQFSCKDLGPIQRVQIGHDNSGFGPGWHCKLVEVTDVTTSTTVAFPCNRWFDRKQAPHQTTQTLFVQGEEAPLVRYVVTIYTSDTRGAGTDANVTLQLVGLLPGGKQPVLGPVPLENSRDNFERAKMDEFHIDGIDLGTIQKAVLRHDGTGVGSAWHVTLLEVKHTAAQKTYSFNIQQWLDRSNHNTVELSPGGNAGKPQHRYKVTVYTSDIRGAGTDADVFLVLYGTKGDTGERALDTSANNFERNMEDVFFVESEPLGHLKKLHIFHNNKGLGPGWHLGRVHVVDLSAQPEASGLEREATFLYNGWLDKNQAPYQISADIYPTDGNSLDRPSEVLYTVTVYTSDRRGAGTDANVFIELHGTEGHVGWTRLEAGRKDFERGGIDEFKIKGSDIGKINGIGIKHDNSGFGPGWHLAHVEVRNESSGDLFMFPCNNWLDSGEGDKKIERQLQAGVGEIGVQPAPPDAACRYKVTVFTSNKFGAGTDANIFVTLKGPVGTIKERKLDHGSRGSMFNNKFERNKEDTFFFDGPKVAPVTNGVWELEEFAIMSDNSNIGSDWHLGHVVLMNVTEGVEMRFLCNDWLNKTQEYKIWRSSEVYASPEEQLQKVEGGLGVYQYKLLTVTGNKMMAGTDAKVTLTLLGEGQAAQWAPVLDQSKKNFQKGKTDTFIVGRDQDFGEISALTVKLDSASDQWFLEKVVVTALHSGREWVFPCNQWVTMKETQMTECHLAKLGAPADAGFTSGATAKNAQYKLIFHTGSKMGAGTDSLVCCELVGENGSSKSLTMDQDRSLFEAKGVDSFERVCPDVGELQQLKVWRGTKGFMDAWYLEKVVVEQVASMRRWEFVFNAWVSADQGKAAVAQAILVESGLSMEEVATQQAKAAEAYASRVAHPQVVVSAQQTMDPEQPSTSHASYSHAIAGSNQKSDQTLLPSPEASVQEAHTYKIAVTTGSKMMAGTDANVRICLKGQMGELWAPDLIQNSSMFERGATDIFNVLRNEDFGEIAGIRIEHDGKGMGSSWYVDRVVVEKVTSGRKWMFDCGRWIDEKGADFQHVQITAAGEPRDIHGSGEGEYEITFHTGNKFGAGTDALVSIEVTGDGGKSGPLTMDKDSSGKLFESKAVDTFSRACPRIGDALNARVWHDGSGMGSAWYLDKVVVADKQSKRTWEFIFNSWIKGGQPMEKPAVVINQGMSPSEMAASTTIQQTLPPPHEPTIPTVPQIELLPPQNMQPPAVASNAHEQTSAQLNTPVTSGPASKAPAQNVSPTSASAPNPIQGPASVPIGSNISNIPTPSIEQTSVQLAPQPQSQQQLLAEPEIGLPVHESPNPPAAGKIPVETGEAVLRASQTEQVHQEPLTGNATGQSNSPIRATVNNSQDEVPTDAANSASEIISAGTSIQAALPSGTASAIPFATHVITIETSKRSEFSVPNGVSTDVDIQLLGDGLAVTANVPYSDTLFEPGGVTVLNFTAPSGFKGSTIKQLRVLLNNCTQPWPLETISVHDIAADIITTFACNSTLREEACELRVMRTAGKGRAENWEEATTVDENGIRIPYWFNGVDSTWEEPEKYLVVTFEAPNDEGKTALDPNVTLESDDELDLPDDLPDAFSEDDEY